MRQQRQEEEECKLVNGDVNNAGYKILCKSAEHVFYRELDTLRTHNAVLVSNAECKQSFLFVYKKALQSPPMEKFVILGNILFLTSNVCTVNMKLLPAAG